MSSVKKISGFPEWLPEQRAYEEQVIDRLKHLFRSFGFLPIETAAVELLSTLQAKGVTGKEIYTLRRVHDEGDSEASIALHFDLTVPFARYVAQNLNELVLPFKRYQVQKVWRGERPQKGRFREFYQCDFDIVVRDELPVACDAEALTLLNRGFSLLNLGEHKIKVNNRKVLLGLYESFGLSAAQQKGAITVIDKIAKIGPEKVHSELTGDLQIESAVADKIIALTSLTSSVAGVKEALSSLGCSNEQFQKGSEELQLMLSLLDADAQSHVVVDLSLARGLDYYTGAIFEVVYPKHPEFGSLGGGGRYEDLASEFTTQKLPGVGASIGISRIMELAIQNDLLPTTSDRAPSVLVSVFNEAQRIRCNEIAATLRAHGVVAEVFYRSPKLGKQIEFAEKKGIRFVAFLSEDNSVLSIKDIKLRTQSEVGDVEAWCKQLVK